MGDGNVFRERPHGSETMRTGEERSAAITEAVAQISEAMEKEKCRACACFRNSLATLEGSYPKEGLSEKLETVMRAARARLKEVQYDCLGCEVCHPALALHVLTEAGLIEGTCIEAGFADGVERRDGWPPLPGDYTVLLYQAPVAVCSLTDGKLATAVTRQPSSKVALVGTLQTENVGIERLVSNIVANPHIRFLVVCGADSRRAVGHLPGQALLALAKNGLDAEKRIVGARGRRPFLHNLPPETVERFRRTVEVVDLVDTGDVAPVLEAVQACAGRYPGPAEAFHQERVVQPEKGYIPERMVPDPAGFFVVYVNRSRRVLSLEHYRNDGVLDNIIEAKRAAELYFPAVEKGLVSRLDHAAYLGCELARAERALETGEEYVQDAAPEKGPRVEVEATCGCETGCKGGSR